MRLRLSFFLVQVATMFLAFLPFRARAQPAADAPLPIDPAVRVGRLANGLTYLVRANHRPERRAELRLVVNAGSILEDDDQRGLAHFVEHMAFNGTTHFRKHELVDYLESIGMRLGADLNAYTGFDETVYMIQVPTDSAAQFVTALRILRDWATEVTFEAEEIDRERGVLVEEWRLGRGADARIRDRQLPVLLQGSRYAERLPIGKKEVLETAPYDAIRRFYRDWYRPDLMAVVAVGDFEAAAVEAQIQTLFADVPAPVHPRPRLAYDIPDHRETRFALADDAEATVPRVSVYYLQSRRDHRTEAAVRQRLVEDLYNRMLNARLNERTQQSDPPFVFAGSGQGDLTRAREHYSLFAAAREGGYERALEALLTEAARVRRFGCTASELEREKAELLRGYERAYNERDKTASRRYAAEYVRHFLTGEPIPGIAYEYALVQRFLPAVTRDEVNRLAAAWITDENRVILADGPTERPPPPASALLAVFDGVAAKAITPYRDEVTEAPLVSHPPAPGTIVEAAPPDVLGVTRWILSNGVRVVLKPTDFKNDEVLLSATSPGGHSLVPDSLFTPALFAASLVGQSGVGAFGPVALEKKLAGKVVRVSPTLGERSEGMQGTASPQDLETLFQLVYLYFTAPRADSVAYVSFRQRIGGLLANFRKDPENVFRDTLSVTLAQHHYRARPFTPEILDEMDLARSFAVYRDRFADAGDFTFYLVGAFDPEAIRPLVTTYLGGLPATGRQETWRDTGIRPPRGVVEKAVYRGTEPRSQVQVVLTGTEAAWSNHDRRLIRALGDVLQLRLREVMREDLGGVYGVGVDAGLSREPVPAYRVNVGFGCDPERVEELTRAAFAVMDSLRAAPPAPSYLNKVREATLRRHEVGLKENSYWMSSLRFMDENDLPPDEMRDGPRRFFDALTPANLQAAARRYLDPTNYVRVVLYPEDFPRRADAR